MRSRLGWWLAAGLTAMLWGQQVHPITGRPIAPVMGAAGADWLERSEREMEELPEAALDALDLKPGMTVADIGAGIGYFSLRMAKRVGPTGKVIAEDIQPEMLSRLLRRSRKANVMNVKPVLGSETNPNLPKGEVDLAIMVDVYHELSHPQEMLRAIRVALKPDGRLVLLEYRKEDPAIPILLEHKLSVKEAKSEVEAEGYVLDKVVGSLPRQHILIFKKATAQ